MEHHGTILNTMCHPRCGLRTGLNESVGLGKSKQSFLLFWLPTPSECNPGTLCIILSKFYACQEKSIFNVLHFLSLRTRFSGIVTQSHSEHRVYPLNKSKECWRFIYQNKAISHTRATAEQDLKQIKGFFKAFIIVWLPYPSLS